MGSRAVAWSAADGSGVLHTRTGRSFSGREVTTALTARLAAAVERAGVFDELATDWVLLDAELLRGRPRPATSSAPSTRRSGPPRGRRCPRRSRHWSRPPTGTGRGRGARPAAPAGRGRRGVHPVYRRYCWPTDGLTGVSFAPFQLLATAGTTYADRPHAWHLSLADRLTGADPELVRSTRSLAVDVTDPAARPRPRGGGRS
jgi:protein phosphatase